MKIAFIVDKFPSLSETFILNQITGLIDLGHYVEIFSGAESTDDQVHDEVKTYSLLDHTHYHNDVPPNPIRRILKALLVLIVVFHKGPLAVLRSLNLFKYGRDAAALYLFFKVTLFLKKGKFDIIQCHFGPNGNLGALLKELGIPGKLVTMFHGYDIRRGLHYGGHIYKKLFDYGDCFLAISEISRKKLLEFGADGEKIRYHPVGIDPNRFSFRWKSGLNKLPSTVVILTVGRLTEEKGLYFGIKAVNELIRQHPDSFIEYRIIGEGPLKRQLEELVSELGIKKNVHFLGSMNYRDVIKSYQEAHLFLLPSTAEMLPVVLMEAMASGLPTVTTSVGAISEIVIDGVSGFLVPAKEVQAMTDRLHFLIEKPEIWMTMGHTGRKHIENNFNVKKLNRGLVEIYRELLLYLRDCFSSHQP